MESGLTLMKPKGIGVDFWEAQTAVLGYLHLSVSSRSVSPKPCRPRVDGTSACACLINALLVVKKFWTKKKLSRHRIWEAKSNHLRSKLSQYSVSHQSSTSLKSLSWRSTGSWGTQGEAASHYTSAISPTAELCLETCLRAKHATHVDRDEILKRLAHFQALNV